MTYTATYLLGLALAVYSICTLGLVVLLACITRSSTDSTTIMFLIYCVLYSAWTVDWKCW